MSDYQLIIQKPKMSELIVDSDLNMGQHEIRARRVYSPIDTEEWETEEIPWNDEAPGDVTEMFTLQHNYGTATSDTFDISSFAGKEIVVHAEYLRESGGINSLQIKIGNDVVATLNIGPADPSQTTVPIKIPDSATILTGTAASPSANGYGVTLSIQETGREWGDKEFDLTGMWLALEQDFGDFSATITLQGVEMPFADYAKYFPIAPSKLSISGTWTYATQRPIVKGYV